MRRHFEEWWFAYAFVGFFALIIAIAANAESREQDRVNRCFDRAMVLVQTPAGPRCAAMSALVPVK